MLLDVGSCPQKFTRCGWPLVAFGSCCRLLPLQAAYGESMVFQVALILLAINGIYVSVVFPETLVDIPATMADKLKVLRANANPFAFCAQLKGSTTNTP